MKTCITQIDRRGGTPGYCESHECMGVYVGVKYEWFKPDSFIKPYYVKYMLGMFMVRHWGK